MSHLRTIVFIATALCMIIKTPVHTKCYCLLDNERMPSMQSPGLTLTLAITGASGAIYAREMLRRLSADARVERIHLVASENALRVLAEELQLSGRNELAQKLLGPEHREALAKVKQLAPEDIGACIASGSYAVDAMVVLPCSMGTLAGIANGLASNLIQRAADVCLKERRRLVLCVRETPFNTIHLRNMQYAAEAGATIYPVIPTHYNHPASEVEMAQQFACRVLAHIGLPQADAYVWKGE
jgi:4-hydroxy-3-polyprenylbenzoate decarboxylase